MMERNINWIDDALRQSTELRDRANEIHAHATKIHQSLWDEIYTELNCLLGRSQSFRGCGVNGDSNDRILYKSNPRGGDRIELHVKLSNTRDEITAHGEAVDVTLHIEKMKDGTVGLTFNGKEETYEQAAERIMKPFLFPELRS